MARKRNTGGNAQQRVAASTAKRIPSTRQEIVEDLRSVAAGGKPGGNRINEAYAAYRARKEQEKPERAMDEAVDAWVQWTQERARTPQYRMAQDEAAEREASGYVSPENYAASIQANQRAAGRIRAGGVVMSDGRYHVGKRAQEDLDRLAQSTARSELAMRAQEDETAMFRGSDYWLRRANELEQKRKASRSGYGGMMQGGAAFRETPEFTAQDRKDWDKAREYYYQVKNAERWGSMPEDLRQKALEAAGYTTDSVLAWQDGDEAALAGMAPDQRAQIQRDQRARRNQIAAILAGAGYKPEEVIEYASRVRNAERMQQEMAGLSEDVTGRGAEGVARGVYGTVQSYATNLLSPIGSVGLLSQKLFRGGAGAEQYRPVDYNTPSMYFSQGTSTIRGAVGGQMGDVGRFFYDTVNSAVDSGVRMLVGQALGGGGIKPSPDMTEAAAEKLNRFVSGFISTQMSGEVFANSFVQAKENGSTDADALLDSVTSALIEGLTEKYSVEAILKNPNGLTWTALRNSFLSEGSEEMASDFLNTIYDELKNGDDSELRTQYRELLASGATEDEAFSQVFGDYVKQVVLDGLAGGLSGIAMSGAAEYMTNKRYEAAYADPADTQALLDEARAVNPDSRLLKRAEQRVAKGKGITGYQARELMGHNEERLAPLKQASEKYGKQSGAMQATYQEGQDVAQYDMSYRVAYEMGKAGTKLSAAQTSTATDYLTDAQKQAAWYAGRDARAKLSDAAEVANGRALLNGQIAEVQTISVQDGKLMAEVRQGESVQTVALDSLKVDAGTRTLAEGAKQYGSAAGTVFAQYKAGQDVAAYLRAADMAAAVGMASPSASSETVLKNLRAGQLGKALSGEQITAIYKAGQTAGRAQLRKTGMTRLGTGTVTFEQSAKGAKLNARQKASVQFIRDLAKVTGIDFTIYQSSADSTGRLQGANGSYRDGTVHVDLNAGAAYEGKLESASMLRTVSHELTHYMAEAAQTEFSALQDFMVQRLSQWEGHSIQDLAEGKMATAEQAGHPITAQEALEEVVADGCEMMLRDSKAVRQLAEENRTLFEKVRNWMKKFFESLRKAFEGVEAVHPESIHMMENYAGELQRLWDEAFTAAVKNAKESGQKNSARTGADVRLSVQDGRLTAESTEQERYELLKDVSIRLASVNEDAVKGVRLEDYNTRKKSAVIPGFRALAKQLGILNVDLQNSEIGFPFQFSGKNLEKSLHHQLEYGGTYQDYVRMMSCFNDLVENAVPIEVHTDKKAGTAKANQELKQVYVLTGAYRDAQNVAPVQFEVKEFEGRGNKLYLSVVLTKISSEVLETGVPGKTGNVPPLFSEPTISLRQIFENVNPADGRFLKYVPDGFLNEAQKNAKAQALRKQEQEYAGYGAKFSDRDSAGRELSAEQAEYFKDSKVRDKDGNLLVMYHGTGDNFTTFDRAKIGGNFGQISDLGFYFTPYYEDARGYASNHRAKGHVMQAYLNITNPLIVEDEGWGSAANQADARHGDLLRWAKDGGHDGIIVRSIDEEFLDEGGNPDTVYIAFSPEQIKNVDNLSPTKNPDIRYSERDDGAQKSIKDQIRANAAALSEMKSVANIRADLRGMNIKEKRQWAENVLKASGYRVDRQAFGVIAFEPRHINEGLNYLSDDGEIAAFAALPQLLKRGKIIDVHNNHKGRDFGTVTIAAPVEINGVRGNMAAVVKRTGKDHYHTHRILMPDGSAFEFLVQEYTEPKPAGALSETDTHATPMDPVSENRIAQNDPAVKRQERDVTITPAEILDEINLDAVTGTAAYDALRDYKNALAEREDIRQKLEAQQDLAQNGPAGERVKAKNRAGIYQKQFDRADTKVKQLRRNTALRQFVESEMAYVNGRQDALNQTDAVHGRYTERFEQRLEEAYQINRTVQERYASMAQQYGTIPAGETPARTVAVPKRTEKSNRVSRTVRTAMEAQATTEEGVRALKKAVVEGNFSYLPITDKAAGSKATETIKDKGYQKALADWTVSMSKGHPGKDAVALGFQLYNQAVNSGDTKTAVQVLTDLASRVREGAQMVQAVRMLKKLSPDNQLYSMQLGMKALQENVNKRYGKKAPKLQMNEVLVNNLLEAENEAQKEAAQKAIYQDLASQLPHTFMDRWNSWRYLCMLGNARTHVRNILGNAGFVPVRRMKDAVALGIETAYSKAKGGNVELSKGFVSPKSDLYKLAKADYENIADLITGGGKYNDAASGIESMKSAFGEKGVWKYLSKIADANSFALDAEDVWFSKPAYAQSLAGYLKANKITAEQFNADEAIRDKARAYAVKEAQRATYRDYNDFSNFIAKVGRTKRGGGTTAKVASTLMEGVLPFRRTPANILVRGVEYSPIGLAQGIYQATRGVKTGKYTAAQAIDRISAGLTGTALVALGALLTAHGILTPPDDDDEKQAGFDKLRGAQSYALKIGKTYVTVDWLAPEALPVFVGSQLSKLFSGDSEGGLKALYSALTTISEPMLEMSMLSSLQDVIENVSYADSKLMAILSTAATNYLTQAFPTLAGQVERITESERETTFATEDSPLTKDLQYILAKVMNKLPGEFQQIPYIDAWGRHEETGTVLARAFNNLLNPAYLSYDKSEPFEDELQRLYDLGYSDMLPQRVKQSQKVEGETLTQDQYVTFAETKGKTQYEALKGIIGSSWYQELSDAARGELLGMAYSYADGMAKLEVNENADVSKWILETKAAVEDGGDISEILRDRLDEDVIDFQTANPQYADLSDNQIHGYLEYCEPVGVPLDVVYDAVQTCKNFEGDKDSSGNTVPGSKKQKVVDYIQSLGLSRTQAKALWDALKGNWKDTDTPWE